MLEIQDVFTVHVVETGEDSDEEKSIAYLSLQKVSKRTMEIKIAFLNPFAISQNILEPDQVKIVLIMPQVIIDAETFEEIEL